MDRQDFFKRFDNKPYKKTEKNDLVEAEGMVEREFEPKKLTFLQKVYLGTRFMGQLIPYTLLCMLLGAICGLIIIGNIGSGYGIFDAIGHMQSSAKYNIVAYGAMNKDPTTKNITDTCKDLAIDQQPLCVVNQVRTFFVFRDNNDTVRTPEQVRLEGGVCRDITVLYASVFKKMGWYTEYRFPTPNHVYIFIRHEIACPGKDKCFIYCDINNENYNGCTVM